LPMSSADGQKTERDDQELAHDGCIVVAWMGNGQGWWCSSC
jgi:hypothetical protein